MGNTVIQVEITGAPVVVASSSVGLYSDAALQNAVTLPVTLQQSATYYSAGSPAVVFKDTAGNTLPESRTFPNTGQPATRYTVRPNPSSTGGGGAASVLGPYGEFGARVNAYDCAGGVFVSGTSRAVAAEPAVTAGFAGYAGVTAAEFGEWVELTEDEWSWRATEPGIYVMQANLELTLSGNAHVNTRLEMRAPSMQWDWYTGESYRLVALGGAGAATLSGEVKNYPPVFASAEALALHAADPSVSAAGIFPRALYRAANSETVSASEWNFLILQLAPGSAFDAWATMES